MNTAKFVTKRDFLFKYLGISEDCFYENFTKTGLTLSVHEDEEIIFINELTIWYNEVLTHQRFLFSNMEGKYLFIPKVSQFLLDRVAKFLEVYDDQEFEKTTKKFSGEPTIRQSIDSGDDDLDVPFVSKALSDKNYELIQQLADSESRNKASLAEIERLHVRLTEAENKASLAEIEDLRRQLSEAEDKAKTLTQEKASLKTECEELEAENILLSEVEDRAEKESQRAETLARENTSLHDRNESLEAEKKALLAENEKLKEDIDTASSNDTGEKKGGVRNCYLIYFISMIFEYSEKNKKVFDSLRRAFLHGGKLEEKYIADTEKCKIKAIAQEDKRFVKNKTEGSNVGLSRGTVRKILDKFKELIDTGAGDCGQEDPSAQLKNESHN